MSLKGILDVYEKFSTCFRCSWDVSKITSDTFSIWVQCLGNHHWVNIKSASYQGYDSSFNNVNVIWHMYVMLSSRKWQHWLRSANTIVWSFSNNYLRSMYVFRCSNYINLLRHNRRLLNCCVCWTQSSLECCCYVMKQLD